MILHDQFSAVTTSYFRPIKIPNNQIIAIIPPVSNIRKQDFSSLLRPLIRSLLLPVNFALAMSINRDKKIGSHETTPFNLWLLHDLIHGHMCHCLFCLCYILLDFPLPVESLPESLSFCALKVSNACVISASISSGLRSYGINKSYSA